MTKTYFNTWHGENCMKPICHTGPLCACVHGKLLQSCLILCAPMDCSPPDSTVHGILQAKYWSGLPCPPLGDLPNPGIEPMSLMSPALAGGFFTTSATWEAWFLWLGSPKTPHMCPTRQSQHTTWLPIPRKEHWSCKTVLLFLNSTYTHMLPEE